MIKLATSLIFIKYVCEQIEGVGAIRYRKMFGEYIVYVNDKPVMTVCDETVYIKKLDVIEEFMKESELGCPYEGAKECYILDIDDSLFSKKIITLVESVTPLPKKKNKTKV